MDFCKADQVKMKSFFLFRSVLIIRINMFIKLGKTKYSKRNRLVARLMSVGS